jgi:hypothetical protein
MLNKKKMAGRVQLENASKKNKMDARVRTTAPNFRNYKITKKMNLPGET